MKECLLIVVIVLDVESDMMRGKYLKSIRLYSPISPPRRFPEYLQCYKGVLQSSQFEFRKYKGSA